MHLLLLHHAFWPPGGQADWKQVCGEFWRPLSAAAQSTADISVRDVIDELDAVLEPHLFPATVRLSWVAHYKRQPVRGTQMLFACTSDLAAYWA